MSIIRVNKQRGRFLVADAEVFEDTGLSFGARGLMAYLLTKPDNWEVRRDHLVSASPAGRVALQRMINELKERGYMHRYQENDLSTGKFLTVTEVYESRNMNPHAGEKQDAPHLETPIYGGTDDTVTTKPTHGDTVSRLPVDGKPVHIVKKDLVNTYNGSFRHLELDPAALPPNAYQEPDPDLTNSMISTISKVCKGYPNILIGKDCPFYSAAVTLIENGITEKQVRAFKKWWPKNGFYSGKPALGSLISEIENSIEGVTHNNKPVQRAESKKAVGELGLWVTGKMKASEFSSPHTLTAIQQVGESSLRSMNQYNNKTLIKKFTDEYERAKQSEVTPT